MPGSLQTSSSRDPARLRGTLASKGIYVRAVFPLFANPAPAMVLALDREEEEERKKREA